MCSKRYNWAFDPLALAITPYYTTLNASSLQSSLQVDSNPKMVLPGSGTRVDLGRPAGNSTNLTMTAPSFVSHTVQIGLVCGQTCSSEQSFLFQGALIETLLVPVGLVQVHSAVCSVSLD